MDTSFRNCYFLVYKGCNYVRNNWIKNSMLHVHPHVKKKISSKFQKCQIKDVEGTRCVMDTQKDKVHFYSPSPPTSSDKQEE